MGIVRGPEALHKLLQDLAHKRTSPINRTRNHGHSMTDRRVGPDRSEVP